MRERLLSEKVALKKIELSLKLQGKTFDSKFINCKNCKFCWGNTPYGMRKPKKWSKEIYSYTTFKYEPNPIPEPEKAGWFCYKYKGAPDHAYLRFNMVRLNAEGLEVKSTWYFDKKGEYTNAPQIGEVDMMVLREPGTSWSFRVCRRFESCPR